MRYAYEPQLQDIYDIRDRHSTQLYPYPQPGVDSPYNLESVRQPRPENPGLTFTGYGIAAQYQWPDGTIHDTWVMGAVPYYATGQPLLYHWPDGTTHLVPFEGFPVINAQQGGLAGYHGGVTDPQKLAPVSPDTGAPVATGQRSGAGLGLNIPIWLWLAAAAGAAVLVMTKQPATALRRA